MSLSGPTHGSTSARRRRAAVIATLLIVLGGCASTRTTPEQPRAAEESRRDPLEKLNRGVHKFNDTIDRNALRPVAVAYHEHTPSWLQKGVGNFFQNLFYPTTIVNQFLQGKFKQGTQDLGRFLLNTTLGWGGVFDVASGAKLPVHDEDFGQTLGRWGVPPGPYVVLPFLGPSTLRDTPARVADHYTQPFGWYDAGNEQYFSMVLYYVDKRAGLLALDRVLNEAYDPYAFVRDAYLQRRQYAVHDGDVPEEAIEDDSDWAEEALREDEAAAEGDAAAPDGASGADDASTGDASAPGDEATDAAPPPPDGQ